MQTKREIELHIYVDFKIWEKDQRVSYMEILILVKLSLFKKCKACGKESHGSAARVKEYLLGYDTQVAL